MTEANDYQTVSMPTTYDPSQAEKKWYDYWIEKGFFKAGQNPEREPYMIVIPPPNVTGML
ncbi:class I tRNA ligase family protein, partial [Paenibacillus larvae]|uniref:class I tRNA ligase family protein n=1 Tax=Paenibacillus larvae TaxID=1464 RepID=UPI0012BA67C0